MGVNKLWDILLTIAVQKRIQDLSGLVLAIDASLWIVKVNSIFQNVDEGLKCIFNKILWLKKNNIKPIFVFDGDTPALKRKTLEERRSKRRQVNDLDINKKVEIQIVKAVTGIQSTKSQNRSMYQEKADEIDKMLNNLLKYQQTVNTIDLGEKALLQAEVLNKKYQLYCQMVPNILQKHGDHDYFSSLDIQSKQQILQRVAVEDLPSGKEIRLLKEKMTEQEKIFYDMELIIKKSKIRQLQDNLYRRVLTKKVENGYEIIQGVYNGKKIIQKRKVKPKNFDEWGINSKKDTCNNFKEIFLQKKIEEPNPQIRQEDEEKNPQNDFFTSIFSKDFSKQKRDSSKTFSQVSHKISENYQKKKQLEQKCKNSQTHNYTRPIPADPFQQQQIDFQQIFNVEPRIPGAQIQPNQPSDPDNLPDYRHVQQLDQIHTSSSNLHLQNMLNILGINYIVAPYEAEAQCAVLQMMGIADGVVTQDSDVFLFGARRVYRGLFQDNIKLYLMSKAEQKLLLNREKMVLFALMLGSDYTDGVRGIGIVNAMEILKVHHTIESLERFTSWASKADILQQDDNNTDKMLQAAISEDERQFYKLHRKFKNYWYVHPNFPQRHIYDAYMEPQVQVGSQLEAKVRERKDMHVDALKELMGQKFQMPAQLIELNLKIFTRGFEKRKQAEITDYVEGNLAKIASKRLQKALDSGAINH